MHNLSDEVLCARWIENPYYQYFCGELSFCHRLPFDRSSMTRWRQRLGEEQLVALIQESLSVVHKTGAIGPKDLERVVVDTTVQPKAVAHPTDARLMHRAIIKLVGLAKRNRVPLRQSYLRLAKRAAIMVGRYTHAHQFKRARRQLKFLRTRLGRIIRDIRRKIDGDAALEARFGPLLDLAQRVRTQDQHQRGPKVYALHAPEVECIGKGKARAPYEFGCKVSIATPVTSPKGGQFVLHAKALHGNPFDGHTLGPVIVDMEKLTGVEARRIHVDKGYRGHNHPHRFRVWISGQVRRVTASIRREMKRRAAVEPVIGHVKAEHPHGPQLPQGPPRRPHQRRPRSSRLQLRSAPAMARSTLACHHPGARRNCPGLKRSPKSPLVRVLHGGPNIPDASAPQCNLALLRGIRLLTLNLNEIPSCVGWPACQRSQSTQCSSPIGSCLTIPRPP
ncbi:IS5 family transposase [Bradyrhizobium sp. GM24.11]